MRVTAIAVAAPIWFHSALRLRRAEDMPMTSALDCHAALRFHERQLD